MKRPIFTILSAVSLILCLAIAVLWLRSYWVLNAHVYCSGQRVVPRQEGSQVVKYARIWAIYLGSGEVGTGYRVDNSPAMSRWHSVGPAAGSGPFRVRSPGLRLLGFEHSVTVGGPLTSSYAGINGQADITICRYLAIPCWFLCALTATLPAIWLWRYRRDRLAQRDDGMRHCAKCDYNLTGNVSGVCPECGTPVPADVVTKTAAGGNF